MLIMLTENIDVVFAEISISAIQKSVNLYPENFGEGTDAEAFIHPRLRLKSSATPPAEKVRARSRRPGDRLASPVLGRSCSGEGVCLEDSVGWGVAGSYS